jgi:hypothetical protein
VREKIQKLKSSQAREILSIRFSGERGARFARLSDPIIPPERCYPARAGYFRKRVIEHEQDNL